MASATRSRSAPRLWTAESQHGCDLCSRYRRRAVYEIVRGLGANVIAFGHTADDFCEALFRNTMFTGRLSALPPVTASRDREFRLIRPLVFVTEDLTRAYAEALRATLARLRAEADARDRPIRARARQAIGARRSAPPAKARVLVLADHWAGAWRIVRALAGVPGIAVHTLICNNTATPPLMFAVRQAAAALRTGVRGALALALASWQGRVRISARPLDDGSTLQWLRDERLWIGLHAMGVIYREPVVASFGRGILNAHIGLLPEYRGRSVMEWSVLAGAPTGVSVFFMDAGIDTGREIVLRRTFDVTGERGTVAAKASLFRRDGEMYRAALHALLDGGPAAEPDNAGGRRYFVMSALLTRVVDGLLVRAINDIPWESRECMSNIA